MSDTALQCALNRNDCLRHANQRAMHTINNLLSGMYGMGQLAQATNKTEHMEKTVEMAVESCRKIKALTLALSAFTDALEQSDPQVKLGDVLGIVLTLQNHDLEKYTITVTDRTDPEMIIPMVHNQLIETLFRLVQNTIDSVEASGTIGFSTAADAGKIILQLSCGGWKLADDPQEACRALNSDEDEINLPDGLRQVQISRSLVRANHAGFSCGIETDGTWNITITFTQ